LPSQSSLPFDGTDAPVAMAAGLALPVPPGHRDELREPDGALRETWARFFSVVGDLRPEALDAHAAAVARQIRDNGVTYNVYADQGGGTRAWQLELLPFLIPETDWAVIEAGVIQRATLANAIMADIYGPQTLLEKGLLPPGLVYGHPGYMRPLKGYLPPGGSFLQTIAVDLVHTDDGWTVIAHRTETPSGMGYALENRLIISGQFAEAFRELRVRRLPPAFAQLISTLAHVPLSTSAQAGDDSGRAAPGVGRQIVLLSPGPFNETYFEHTFLARYLGITLVEGKDLTVRNDVVYLKTFGGLERVDVILRRLDDVFCDPLELRSDSTIGVPGLLEAMRAGNVMVSNVPGSGFLESPAIHGFMPGMARALLGEPLRLPSVMSWWCGEAAAHEQALRVMDHAFVMPTYPRAPGDAPLGMEQGLQALDDWRARIAEAPDRYTLQAPLPLSHMPCWEPGANGGGRIGSRAAMLRVYAVADGNGGWQVMPGGFLRLAPPSLEAVSMQLGGTSADTWVVSSQPAHGLMPLARAARGSVPGLGANAVTRPLAVSSRAAENLFWAGRYAERAENVVRLCRQILGSIESNDETDDGTLNMIGQLAQWFGLVPPQTPSPQASLRVFERSLVSALADVNAASGLIPTLAAHARAANEIRNRLSNDHWRTILAARNDFQDAMAKAACPAGGAAQGERAYDRSLVLDALEHLSMQLGAISGAQGDRMTRDEAWRLVFIGRHIERLGTLALFLEVAERSGALASRSGFDLLLHLFDSTLTYRSLFPGRTDVPALVDLLVLEPTNPRGLYGVLDRLRDKLAQLPAGTHAQARVPLAELLPPVSALPSRTLLCQRDQDRFMKLSALCDQLGARMARLSEEIGGRYFSHAGVAPETDLP